MIEFLKEKKVFFIGLILILLSMFNNLLLFAIFTYLSINVCINLFKFFVTRFTNISYDLDKIKENMNLSITLFIMLLLLMLFFKTSGFIVFVIMGLMTLLILKEIYKFKAKG